ncbi:MAG: efflux RND transporter periplasmic adaptor subunit [Coleofasciculaceae cyanobacterium]
MAKVSVRRSSQSLITVLLLCAIASACSRGKPPQGAGPPPGVLVKLQRVETSTVEDSSEFVGSLEAANRVVLKPEVEGRVTQILVSSGNRVAAGTPIVQLRPDKNQAEVGGAVANVNAARAALSNAKAQLKAAEAEKVRAAADLELQNQQFERISKLVSQGAFARQQLDQVRRDRDTARAALEAAEERINAASATIDQENSTLQQAQSNVTLRTEELKDNRVVAPISGVVGDIPVKLGDYVKAGDTLTTLIQNDTLDLRLSVPVERGTQLRVGLPVQLADAKSDQILATGRISFVSPQVDTQSQAILAKASFPNPEGTLRDGQFVRSRVIWDRSPGVSIPTTAVSRVAGQPFVFVAQKQGQSQLIAKQKPVKLGPIQGNQYRVLEGVQPGETIIVSGLLNLSDGAPIKPES